MRKNEKKARNKVIAIAVLDGQTLSSVAKQYGITVERVRQITAYVCRQANRDRFEYGQGVIWMRKHRAEFWDAIQQLPIDFNQ